MQNPILIIVAATAIPSLAYAGDSDVEFFRQLMAEKGIKWEPPGATGSIKTPIGPVEAAFRRTAGEQAAAATNNLEAHRGGDGQDYMMLAMAARANPFV